MEMTTLSLMCITLCSGKVRHVLNRDIGEVREDGVVIGEDDFISFEMIDTVEVK